MGSETTFVGEIHNYGHMPIGGSQTYHITQEGKRTRTFETKRVYRIIGDEGDSSSCFAIDEDGTRTPIRGDYMETFDAEDPPFWQLWVRYPECMLHLGDGVPLTNLHTPLSWCGDTFYMCDWTPEHEELRSELNKLKYSQILEEIEKDLREAQSKVDYHTKRKEECLLRLDQCK